VLLQVLDKALVHRWNAEEHRAVSLQLSHYRLGAEWNQRHRSPRHQRPMKCNAEAVDVKERQRMDNPIATPPPPRFDHPARLREHVAVVEQCALRLARGS